MVERMGFEPMKPLGLHAFQACAIDHSAISPKTVFNSLMTLSLLLSGHPQYESLTA